MPDMREGGLGTAACYLTVERLALQAGVESPFWDEASLLMGGCEEPWYKKPLTPRRLRSFLKRYGGSLPDDDGQRGHAASVFADVMRLHGIPMEDGADDLGALYVRRAESVGMTVAFLATGCTLADMAAITGFCEEAIVQRVTRTWDGVPFCWDYQIKGFFKDACSSLRRVPGTRSSKLTAFKKVIDGTVFVEQRKIPFKLPDGAQCGRCERPLRASSASGERVALAASETVPAGTVIEFSVLVMNPKDAETVREWLDYGHLRGLFQWRNSGKGRFEWEEVESED